jgi:hypothetical protein
MNPGMRFQKCARARVSSNSRLDRSWIFVFDSLDVGPLESMVGLRFHFSA